MTRKAIFLDRDGVLVRHIVERGPRETPLIPEEVVLFEGVREGLSILANMGYELVVVTNQPDIAKGKVSRETMATIEESFKTLVNHVPLAYYACYHHPDSAQVVVPELLKDCDCRKPRPGLIIRATIELNIDLSKSWLIGDQLTDIEAGARGGITPDHLILIGQPKGNAQKLAANFTEAVELILKGGTL